eukprot:m.229649 g.229649  ORF g.229649 m.229649 type:complete len:590 (+) comp17344_c0_seq2:2537-4306(+)
MTSAATTDAMGIPQIDPTLGNFTLDTAFKAWQLEPCLRLSDLSIQAAHDEAAKAEHEDGMGVLPSTAADASELPGNLNERVDVNHDFDVPSWPCEMVPVCNTEQEMLDAIQAGKPFFPPEDYANQFSDITDGLSYLQTQAPSFIKPQIAFRGGWGRPASALADHSMLKLVNSVSDVLAETTALNLQMFHRHASTKLPPLPEQLRWPLPEIFGGATQEAEVLSFSPEQTEGGAAKPQEALSGAGTCSLTGAGVILDNATRVSQRGACTWWHLDDVAEHVYQTALPLEAAPHLLGPNGGKVTKLFIYAPVDAYPLITQDDRQEGEDDGLVAAVNPFKCPAHHLPKGPDTYQLPRLMVAALEAGGRPLMSAPNLPHLVLTIQDCVMVEQRRLSLLFMDEVAYFAERIRRWREPPVLYAVFSLGLKDPGFVAQTIVKRLLGLLQSADASAALARDRAYCSLKAMTRYARHWLIPRPILGVLRQKLIDYEQQAQGVTSSAHSRGLERAQLGMRQSAVGVTPLGEQGYSACVHVGARPRWGLVRASMHQAKQDGILLKAAVEAGNLEAVLQQQADGEAQTTALAEEPDSLDDLFD